MVRGVAWGLGSIRDSRQSIQFQKSSWAKTHYAAVVTRRSPGYPTWGQGEELKPLGDNHGHLQPLPPPAHIDK